MTPSDAKPSIAVIGLGYVGLPLAIALAKHFPLTGFDISRGRVAELAQGRDRTDEVPEEVLRTTACRFTAEAKDLADAEIGRAHV